MIEAVLFDLDGTLLDIDIATFMPHYLQALAGNLAHLADPERLIQAMLGATQHMIDRRDRQETNEVAFWRAFASLLPGPVAAIRTGAAEYYATRYDQLQPLTRPHAGAHDVVQRVLALGRQAVVATNPLFPRAALTRRVRWAGLIPDVFAFITAYEDMHATKPHGDYYLEIAGRLGVSPERCLMVGDDAAMDRPAATVGMRFFHITNQTPGAAEGGSLRHLDQRLRAGWLDE
jgi:HAD superfamily hydrolase (TIGR01549 family)